MIWASLLATAIIFAALSWGDKSSRRALLTCAAGIIAMQLFKAAGMGDLIWLCSSATWVSIGVYILQVNGRDTAPCALLLIASGLCYAIGRMSGGFFSTGNPVMLAADFFGIIAMLFAGWRGVCITRGCWLGRGVLGLRGRFDHNHTNRSGCNKEKRVGHSHV